MSEYHATNGNGHSKHGMNGHSRSKHAMNAYYAAELETDWKENTRWKGIVRPYSAEDVIRLRGYRKPGSSAGEGRIEGNLSEWLASCC